MIALRCAGCGAPPPKVDPSITVTAASAPSSCAKCGGTTWVGDVSQQTRGAIDRKVKGRT